MNLKRTFVLLLLLVLVLAVGTASGHHKPGHGKGPLPTPTVAPATPTPTQPPPTPTPVPDPTQPPPQPGEPYPGAPACPDHSGRAWHGLWDAARGCHHDHTHGDNPHDLDYKLGTRVYELIGYETGAPADYGPPWQTHSSAGHENDTKHAGHINYVRDNIPCDGVPSPCINAFRAWVHQHSILDAAVQYHSCLLEGTTSDGGYFLFPGWCDFGDLHVPEGNVVVNVDGNHDSYSGGGAGRHKQHSASGTPQIIWYGATRQFPDGVNGPRGFVTLSSSVHDAWVYTDPITGGPGPYACYPDARCRANATVFRPHLISFKAITAFPFIFDESGRANWEGWANRYGLLYETSDCTAPSLDCVPIIMRNLRRDYDYQTANSATANSYRDYDVYFDGQPSGWSQPRN